MRHGEDLGSSSWPTSVEWVLVELVSLYGSQPIRFIGEGKSEKSSLKESSLELGFWHGRSPHREENHPKISKGRRSGKNATPRRPLMVAYLQRLKFENN